MLRLGASDIVMARHKQSEHLHIVEQDGVDVLCCRQWAQLWLSWCPN